MPSHDRITRNVLAVAFAAAALLSGCAGSRAVPRSDLPAPPLKEVELRGWDLVVEQLRLRAPSLQESADDTLTLSRAWSALSEGRLVEANRLAAQLTTVSSTDVDILRAFIAMRTGRSEEAADLLRESRDSARASRSTKLACASGLFLITFNDARLEDAFQEIEAIRAMAPDHPIIGHYRTSLRAELAHHWLMTARQAAGPEPASMAYDRALLYAPESATLHIEAARTYRLAGQLGRAEASAFRAVSLEPDDASTLALYGDVLAEEGKIAEAHDAYERASLLDPKNPWLEARRRQLDWELQTKRPPPQYSELRSSPRLEREQLAALLVVELSPYLPRRFDATSFSPETIVTDIDDSWARAFIMDALALGMLRPLPNHTFGGSLPVTITEFEQAIRRATELVASASEPSVNVETVSSERRRPHFVSGARAIEAVSRVAAHAERIRAQRLTRANQTPRPTPDPHR